jgi:hypothetical protein
MLKTITCNRQTHYIKPRKVKVVASVDKQMSALFESYLEQHYPGIGGTLAKKKKPKNLPYAVPEDKLLKVARTVKGWAMHSYGTTTAQGRVVTVFEYKFRGAFTFPDNQLKIEGVDRVHSFVKEGTAKVWVTWKPAEFIP